MYNWLCITLFLSTRRKLYVLWFLQNSLSPPLCKTQPKSTKGRDILSINFCTFLIIYFWITHRVISLSQLPLEFYFCWFGANRKKTRTNNPQKRWKRFEMSCRDHPEEKSNTHRGPLLPLSLVLRCLFILFWWCKVTRVFLLGFFSFCLVLGGVVSHT